MDNPRPEKVAVVEEVRERLSSVDAALLTEYRGLKVGEMAQLRRNLREAGGEYTVYKNSLVRFAVRELGLAELEELLTGPTAIAFVHGDAVNVAKALRDYARGNPALVVKGGLLAGRAMSAAEANALAEVPPREVLLARFAGLLAAPMQQLAGLLQALPRNFAYGLAALVDKAGASGASGAPATEAGEAAEAEPAPPTAPAAKAAAEPEEAAEPEVAPDAHDAAAADAAVATDEAVTDPAPDVTGAEADTQEES